MDLSIDEVIKRLLLLGLPLVPLGCSDGGHVSGLPDAAIVEFDGGAGAGGGAGGMGGGTGVVGGPSGCVPASYPISGTVTAMGSEVTPAAWTACLDSGDCLSLCRQVQDKLPRSVSQVVINSCQRIDPPLPGDGGADAGGALDARDAASDGDTSNGPQKVVVFLEGQQFNTCGRRPAGLVRSRAPSCGGEVGQWLADAATLEAASVPAFRRLARELAAHGAPERLVEAARGAAREEARHYALMRRLARAHGVEPRRPRVRALPVRSLGALARENAREGCVRETFGAMIAAHQAAHAADAVTRDAMAAIAVDESRHAQLAWEVDAWARATLPRDEARAVARARRDAATKLLRDLGRGEVPAGVAQTLGLPSAAAAQAQARRAHAALWSA